MTGHRRIFRIAAALSILTGILAWNSGAALAQQRVAASPPLAPVVPSLQETSPAAPLAAIAQWQVPGIGAVPVIKTSQLPTMTSPQATLFAGVARLLQAPNQPPAQIVGFRLSTQRPFNIAVILPRFSLPSLVPALQSTPLADIAFDRAVMILVPPGTGPGDIALPPQVAQILGRASFPVVEGSNFVSWPTISGQVGTLLSHFGVPNIAPPLTGKFDPAVLTAPLGRGQLAASFVPMLDLSVPLGNPRANWMPGFLALDKARLSIKGDKGAIVAAIAADVSINVGAGQPLVFADTQLTRDTRSGKLTLAGGPIKPPAGALTLPSNIASLDTLSFVGTIDGNTRTFTLNGSAQIAGKPEPFTVTLSGTGGRANYAFSLTGTQSLASLLGWQFPGLDDIQISNITKGSGGAAGGSSTPSPSYTGGTLQIGSIPANLFVFKPSKPGVPSTRTGAASPGAATSSGGTSTSSLGAITLPSLHLPDLIPQLKGSPLDGLQIGKPGMILAPSGLSFSALALPAPMATQTGSSSTDAKGGLNLKGQAMPTGEIAELIRSVGLSNLLSAGLPLTGNIDPRLLKAGAIGADIVNAILASIDLNMPLGNIKPDWTAGYLAFNNAKLTVKNVKGAIVAAVAADVSINVGAGQPLVFADTQLTRDTRSGKITLAGGPIKPLAGALTLPSNIASLDTLSFAGTIDGNTRTFTLSGSAQIAGKPESFTVTLSGTGGRADYAFSLTGTQSLASLLGWQIPGLEDLMVSNISIGSGGGATGGPSYTGGTIQIGNIAASLFVFKPSRPGVPSPRSGSGSSGAGTSSSSGAGGSPSLAAITLPSLHLPDFIPQLKGSPLDGVQISKPGFILAPSGLSFSALTLPGPVATHTGSSSADVKGGLNLKGLALPAGKMADLVNAAGLGRLISAGLPLSGSLDPRLLKGSSVAGDIASAIIASIDFSAPLGALSLPGVSSLLSATSSTLAIKGHTDGVTVSLGAPISLSAGKHRYTFDSTITVDRQGGATETTIAGSYPAASEKGAATAIDAAFGIPWLKLEKVGLSVTLGSKKSISVSGTTTMGKIRDLKAAVFVDAEGSQVTDFGVSLTGADIGLADIPGFAALRNLPDIRFRDLLISETEVAGTLRTSNSMFNNLRAVIFRNGNQVTLAAVREKFTLEDIIPLPGPAKAVFSSIVFDKGLLIISEAGVQGTISSLPKAAAAVLTEVYGDANRRLKLGNGFNLAIALDPSAMGKGMGQLGMGRGKFVLDGGIEGVFGGTPAFMLSVAIPPVNFPPALGFLSPPQNLTTAFFIKLTAAPDASLGVSVSGDFPMKTRQGSVIFTNAIAFELDAQGGLAIELTGTSDTPWPKPLGIPGLTLNPGTSLGLKVSATSEVDLTFIGKSTIGKKEIDLTGSAGILVAEGVIDKGAFEGKLSEIGLEDIVAMSNAAAAASGGKPPATNFPVAKLTNVDVAFASPGAVVQGMNLSGGGSRIAGDLWLILKDKPLGKLLAQVDGNGIILSGSISDFSLGPVELRGVSLDARATLMPPAPPYFKVKGAARLFKKDQDAELVLSPTDMELGIDIDLGDLLKFDFRAKAEIPLQGMNPAELAKSDMSLDARLRSDIPAWLRGPGRKPVDQAFASVRKGLTQVTNDLNAAQKKVSDLNTQIDAARAQVNREKRSAEQNLKDAEDHVNSLATQIRQLDSQISDAKSKTGKCNQTKRICTWYDIIKKKCTSHKDVPDLGAIASCEADNVKYGSIVAAKTTAREGVVAAKVTADGTLDALRRGEAINDTDLDPRVAPLIAARVTAQGALKLAQDAAQGALRAEAAIQSALNAFSRSDAFVLKEGVIQGSLQKSIAGRPVLLGLDFTAFGKPYNMNLAFSISDPAFDAEQLAALGLFLASKILDETHAKDPTMAPFLALVHDAYNAAHDATHARVEAAMKENGLE